MAVLRASLPNHLHVKLLIVYSRMNAGTQKYVHSKCLRRWQDSVQRLVQWRDKIDGKSPLMAPLLIVGVSLAKCMCPHAVTHHCRARGINPGACVHADRAHRCSVCRELYSMAPRPAGGQWRLWGAARTVAATCLIALLALGLTGSCSELTMAKSTIPAAWLAMLPSNVYTTHPVPRPTSTSSALNSK